MPSEPIGAIVLFSPGTTWFQTSRELRWWILIVIQAGETVGEFVGTLNKVQR
jgi:hypothetical protein